MNASQPLLVTHVITRLIVGGAQENTVSTVLGLQEKKEFRTDLISGPTAGSEGSLESEFRECPGALRFTPSLVRPVQPLTDLKAVFELRRIFQEERPSIVHTHSGKAGIVGRWAARMANVPIILHGIHGPSFGPWQGARANAAFRFAEQTAGKVTTHFAAVAKAMIDQYLAVGIGSPVQYTRIFSGFHLEPFLQAQNDLSLRSKLGLGSDDFVIGKIARLCELKGHDDLFQIAPAFVKNFPKARFLLVGGGPWEDRFRKMATESGLSRHFIFTGLVPPREIPALAGIMDVLVHLSLREGLPRALPQAMAAGKPVIAYDCDGAGEVCITGQTGFLVRARDREGVLKALGALANDVELRKRLGEAGRGYVRERFPVQRMVDDTHLLYLRLLAEKGLRTR